MQKPELRFALFFLLQTVAITLSAQPPLSRVYTATDGLAMTESAHVCVDRLGYLWANSTNGRVSRFDGQQWKAYPADGPEGLNFSYLLRLGNNDLLGLRGDLSNASYLSILRGDTLISITGLPDNVNVLNHQGSERHFYVNQNEQVFRIRLTDYQVDSTFSLVVPPEFQVRTGIFTSNGSILLTSPNSTPDQAARYCWNGDRSIADIFTLPGNAYLRAFINGKFFSYLPGTHQLYVYDEQFNRVQTIDYAGQLVGPRFEIIRRSNGKYNLKEFIPSTTVDEAPRVNLHHFNPAQPEDLELFLTFYPKSANGTNHDMANDGTVWVGSHNGVERYYPGTVEMPSLRKGMVNSLHAVAEEANGGILFGGYGSGFTRFQGGTLERLIRQPFSSTLQVMPCSYRDELGQTLFLLDDRIPRRGLLKLNKEEQAEVIRIPDPKNPLVALTGYHFSEAMLPTDAPLFGGRQFPENQDSVRQLVISLTGTPTGPSKTRKGQFALLDLPVTDNPTVRIIDGRKGIETTNIVCTAQDRSGRIWFSQASTGMGVYDPVRDTAVTWLVDRDDALGAVSMVVDQNDRLWFGGRTALYYIDDASSIALVPSLHLRARQKKCEIRDIPEAYVAALLLEGDTLIVGHRDGVSLIDVNDPLPAPPALTFPTGDFLGMSEQNALLLDRNNRLWVGADDGAVRLDRSVFGRGRGMQGKVKIAMSSDLGPLSPDPNGNFILPLGDRSLIHGYQLSVADQFSGHIDADVYLINTSGDTLSVEKNMGSGETIRSPYLPPGTYHLETYLFANNQLIEQRSTRLRIPFHLTERWWFWAAIFGGIAAIIIVLLRNRIIRTQAKLERERLMSQLTQAKLELSETRREKDRMQVTSLTGAINPHFISNAIEWLQSAYFIGRPIEDMDEMAENLSSVIRIIFTKSIGESPSHPLSEELDLVRRYFRTVNIQYDESFEFNLPAPDQIEAMGHHQVLLMQLQVYVENAIEHGLRYRKKAGKVSIHLREDSDYIYVAVEDDGAGVDFVRKKQAASNRRDGSGTSIIAKLQDTFNAYNERLLYTTINSPTSTDEDGMPFGTRITVAIPKHYSYALDSLGR